jgi:type IV secretory pathway VirB10-like protein
MTNTDRAPFSAPTVKNRSTKPPGVLPRGTRSIVIGGIALLMVIVIFLSARNTPPERKLPTPAAGAIAYSNAEVIKDYQTRIDEQVKKLREEQARWAQARQGDVPSNPAPVAGEIAPDPPRDPGYATYTTERSIDSLRSDRRKREYESLFASNVALSYRRDPASKARSEAATDSTPGVRPAGAEAPGDFTVMPSVPRPVWPSLSFVSPSTPPAQSPAPPAQSQQNANRPAEDPAADGGRKAANELKQAEGKFYRLFEGTVLETVLTNRLDGSFSGPVNCMVTTNVYSKNRQHVLIPQGSRVLGEVRRVETFGDQRLAVAFHRLIMPDGFSVSLDKFPGLNQIGETGLVDQVNRHYLQVFGASLAIGAIAGLSQANTRYGFDASAADTYRQGAAASLSQSSLHILDRYLNVLPTFTVREGHRVKIYLTADLPLPAYEKHRIPDDL